MLHIGLDKTGTTSIQNAFYSNRESLLVEEGFLYPSLMPNLSTPLLTIFKHNPHEHRANKMAGLPYEEVEKRQQNYLKSLEAEISSCDWSTLLLSAEGLSSLRESEVAKLGEWGEQYSENWTVLVCVRHPVTWGCSVVQERLKQGSALKQVYQDPPTPNYRRKISNVISVFGKENVRVFDFETASEGIGGVVSTFAAQAGLSSLACEFLARQAVRTNESLSLEGAHILDSLNRQRPVFSGGARAPRRPGTRHVLPYISRIDGRRFDIPDTVKEKIRAQSHDDVEWLNETFGLNLYSDVTRSIPRGKGHESSEEEGHKEAVKALSDPAIDSIAETFGELITADIFRRSIKRGRVALAQGNLERAERMFREAAWLDPDAPQPKKLLKKVTKKRLLLRDVTLETREHDF